MKEHGCLAVAAALAGPAPRTLDFGAMPACVVMDAKRIADLAHETARLGYQLAKVTWGGQVLFVEARFRPAPPKAPKKETLRMIAKLGLIYQPALPTRPELQQWDCTN